MKKKVAKQKPQKPTTTKKQCLGQEEIECEGDICLK